MSMFHIEQGMMNALLVGWSTYQGFIRPNSWFSQALLVVGRFVGGVGWLAITCIRNIYIYQIIYVYIYIYIAV